MYKPSTAYFNPRSDERSDMVKSNQQSHYNHFNPRSDERSDRVVCSYRLLLLISIHAPTNGATIMLANTINRRSISIHAPTNGATSSPHSPVIIACHFNPRSDERSDLTRIVVFPEEKNISIHAPTNGATVSGCLILMKTMKFQSTLRRTERPDQGRKGRQGQSISIHAPTNGATLTQYPAMM